MAAIPIAFHRYTSACAQTGIDPGRVTTDLIQDSLIRLINLDKCCTSLVLLVRSMVEQNISIVCISPAAAHKKEDRGGSFLSPRHYKFLKPYNMILIHSVKLE
jgi:hypothetical protein